MNGMIVIGHYYDNREEHLDKILYHLAGHGYPVCIWDNSPARSYVIPDRFEGVHLVRCPANPIHGRYLATLIWPEIHYFLFQDDDLILPHTTMHALFNAARRDRTRFHGIEGRKLDLTSPTPYLNAIRARYPEPCDMLIRAYAGHRSCVMHGLNWINDRQISPGRSETLLFTWKGQLIDIPIGSELDWINLPEFETGLSYAPEHGPEIDEFYNKYFTDGTR